MRLSCARGVVFSGVVAGLSMVPGVVRAQAEAAASTCSVDPNTPKELAIMELDFQRARSATTPEVRLAALRKIAKELDTKPERFAKNAGGYQYRMSQLLTMWAMDSTVGYTPLRGTLGFVTNPTEPVDLVQAMDQSYKAIIVAVPDCADEMNAQRQNEVWLAVTRRALDASNGGEIDTAELYAKRSLLLSAANPYPHYVLANVANTRKDQANAMMHWKHVISHAGTDTTYTELKNSSLYLLSVNQLEAAEAATGAAKAEMAKEAAGSFRALIAATPKSADVPNMMTSLADALAMAGDSAAIPSVYADLLANPSAHSDIALTMGGVIAVRINKSDDAIKLFDAAAKKNSYARDALRNLAATYYGKDMYQEMFAPSRKLVENDPNNFDGWMMFAYASQGLAKGAKVAAEKKAWTDSLVKYQTYAEALPVKVDVSSFQRGAKDVTLTLQFQQQAATEGNYNVTVEFVDATGNVVGTATSSVGPIKSGESKNAVFKAVAEGVMGYRYKALK